MRRGVLGFLVASMLIGCDDSGSGGVSGLPWPQGLTFTSKTAVRTRVSYTLDGIQNSEYVIVLGRDAVACDALQFESTATAPMLALHANQELVMIELFGLFGYQRSFLNDSDESGRGADWRIGDPYVSTIGSSRIGRVALLHAGDACDGAGRQDATFGNITVDRYQGYPHNQPPLHSTVEEGSFEVKISEASFRGTFENLTTCPDQAAITVADEFCPI